MSTLIDILNIATLIANYFGVFVLSAIGLAIIFGIMGVINLAHGEFILIGAFSTALIYHQGIPLPIAILVGGLATGVFGVITERLIIQHLYGRLIDTLVATWGLSLIITQTTRIIFGTYLEGISTPFGAITYGSYNATAYKFVLAGTGVALFVITYLILMYTEYGLHARATMQNKEMARTLGVPTPKIYMQTFFLGSVLTGIAGGLLAPTTVLSPTMGRSYLIEAFVTVIVGGANVLIGTSLAGLFLGTIKAPVAQLYGTLGGNVALLVATILIIRVLPEGITGLLERN